MEILDRTERCALKTRLDRLFFYPALCFFFVVLPQHAVAQVAYSKAGSLVTVVHGIRDEASDSWVNVAGAIAPTHDRYVVREEGITTSKNLTLVNADHIISLPLNASPQLIKEKLSQISHSRDVTVFVDMKLGLNVTEAAWTPHTKWASNVAEALAESHAAAFPNANSLFIGHSAGTEPVAMMPETMPDRRKKAAGDRRLYDDIMVLSGRRSPEDPGYPKWAVLCFADGDLYANPKGHIGMDSVFKTYGPEDAVALAKKGYSVVRIIEPQGSAWGEVVSAQLPVLVQVGMAANHRVEMHRVPTEVTTDQQMVYYAPNSAEPIALPKTTVASALHLATDVEGGRVSDVKTAVETMNAKQPTKGIGGISLNATAYVPVEPEDVDYAGYSGANSALFLKLKDGRTWTLPAMDPETLRQSYETAYRDGVKAELSIGRNRSTSPEAKQVSNLARAGDFSVYYFGNSRDTLLGLVMFNADHMLGELAFTTSAAVQEVEQQVPGFRSLVELFPEKYAENPAQGNYIGWDGRIYLTPQTVVLEKSATQDRLDFADLEVSIHFGQTGPAESAYGAFFTAHFQDILKTQSGAPFADLVPYARAAGVFRWMRDNKIRFDPGELANVEVSQVFTPTSCPIEHSTKLEDVDVKAPTVFYDLLGPTRFVLADGRESTVSYANGRVSEVHRYDGKTLHVYRDSIGLPVAVKWSNTHAAGFLVNAKGGLVLAQDVGLEPGDFGPSVKLLPSSSIYQIVNPESIVMSFVVRFASGEVNL